MQPAGGRPIIFDAESVRAILEGRKPQTRRVIKPQPDGELFPIRGSSNDLKVGHWRILASRQVVKCPYGQPGDRLWVRESWQLWIAVSSLDYAGSDWSLYDGIPAEYDPGYGEQWDLVYRADASDAEGPWRSPIYMPHWASRITLEITGVRVERVQDISEQDICQELGAPIVWSGPGAEPYKRDLYGRFSERWDMLNAKRGYPWSSNPWTWCIEFKLM